MPPCAHPAWARGTAQELKPATRDRETWEKVARFVVKPQSGSNDLPGAQAVARGTRSGLASPVESPPDAPVWSLELGLAHTLCVLELS